MKSHGLAQNTRRRIQALEGCRVAQEERTLEARLGIDTELLLRTPAYLGRASGTIKKRES